VCISDGAFSYVFNIMCVQVTLRSFLLERKRQSLGGGGGGKGSLAAQQLPNDSEDSSNPRQEYENSSSFQLPSGDSKKFVRV
jgi:hypothetical protein